MVHKIRDATILVPSSFLYVGLWSPTVSTNLSGSTIYSFKKLEELHTMVVNSYFLEWNLLGEEIYGDRIHALVTELVVHRSELDQKGSRKQKLKPLRYKIRLEFEVRMPHLIGQLPPNNS
jgi:hypothetical protein